MAKSTTAAKAANDVAAIATEDGHAILGGRPATPAWLEQVQRQASGLPPVGAKDAPAVFNGETAAIPVSVARNALHKHMADLSGKIAAEINDPYKFMGNGPYIDQMRAQWRTMADMAIAEKEQAKAELDRLGKLTDAQVIEWAVTNNHIARHVSGGWVAV